MTEFLLIRHATNDWVNTGRLAGWTPGVHLNEDGTAQAAALADSLAKARIAAIYSSPLERTMETAQAIAAHYPALSVQALEGVGEVRYGKWQGEKLSRLRREPRWEIIQVYPSRAHFPGGEAIRQAQARAVDALESLVGRHPNQRVAIVSHSDIIKLIVAHYLGAHVDFFQRIEISPASLTIIALGTGRPYIIRVNDTSYLASLRPAPRHSGPWERLKRRFSLGWR
ncbi:MAG: MSMEG_4193 family putative phosphomutase [Chloroflexi bacterium]|nr:MAG: MSMEG_4193 family putative phosphomutase [Chloroflexota bacterium]